MTLTLPLKREYFEQIKAGTKRYEYRLVNKYWKARIQGRTFDKIVLTLGYPKRSDTSRRIERPWRGCRKIWLSHPEFGKESVRVFSIRVN